MWAQEQVLLLLAHELRASRLRLKVWCWCALSASNSTPQRPRPAPYPPRVPQTRYLRMCHPLHHRAKKWLLGRPPAICSGHPMAKRAF